jgi:hypothetical protein
VHGPDLEVFAVVPIIDDVVISGLPPSLAVRPDEIVVGYGSPNPQLRVTRDDESSSVVLVGRRGRTYKAIWLRTATGSAKLGFVPGSRKRAAAVFDRFGWRYDVVWG